MVVQKRFILKTPYVGSPKASNFEYQEVDIDDDIKDGEYFYEALYISVDPCIRTELCTTDNHGKIVSSLQLSRITKSKHPDFPVGQVVLQYTGWCSVGKQYAGSSRSIGNNTGSVVFLGPYPYDEKTVSLGLNTLGLTGLTAYVGLINICKPKEGETVMVTTGAGAVGTVVGQLAKIKGCRVIGSCGSDEKVKLMKSIGYDDAFNYKTCTDWNSTIKQMAPNGIDCFYDNVGGEMADSIYQNMNQYGRIASCGNLSSYNATEPVKVQSMQGYFVMKELTMTGFLMNSEHFRSKYNVMVEDLRNWLKQGKLKPIEHVTEGFENIPKAFIEMFEGKNIGKAVVKI